MYSVSGPLCLLLFRYELREFERQWRTCAVLHAAGFLQLQTSVVAVLVTDADMDFSQVAAVGTTVSEKKEEQTASGNAAHFPAYPGEDCLAHDAQLCQEQAEARLAQRSLLAVAQGGTPPTAAAIIDIAFDILAAA